MRSARAFRYQYAAAGRARAVEEPGIRALHERAGPPGWSQAYELRTGFQQVRQGRGGCYDLLEVVEQQQEVLVSQEGCEEVQQGACSTLFEFKHLGNGGNNQVRVANG